MITPSFGLTATERVLPSLALDFTTASLDPRITFTRTTGASNPATYVNSSGVITAATNNQPRFNYDPVTLVCKGLLIEESRQNKYTYSNTLNNVIWVQSFVTVTTAAFTAPDGSATSYVIVPTAGNASFRELQQNTSVTSGVTYCISGYYRQKEHRYVQIIGSSAAFGTFYVNFDLQTGTETAFSAGTSTVVGRGITPAGNGWYRVWAAVTALSTSSSRLAVDIIAAPTDVRGVAFVANGTDGLYAFGAQFEQGSFPTSYIPTTTTALTRNADTATMTGTNFSDWYNASEGALFAQASTFSNASTDKFVANINNNGFPNRILMNFSATNNFSASVVSNSVSQVSGTNGVSAALNTSIKMCFATKLDNFAFSQSGVAPTTDNLGAMPVTVDRLWIGSATTSSFLNGHVQRIMFWPQRLTNAEVQAFSK